MGVSQGLAYLHGRTSPTVLLDVSSKNVFLKSKREAVVGDVEICKVIHASEQGTGSLSTVAGSVGYIPPGELLADLYICLCFCCSGGFF
ncbi:Leucine-rich repeat receptor-like tyrosine-protein kinase [Acorus gramineus]|uniref:Leucine-rich repeat receptor-like tyrosine-protein kinase n=1 Tax=Acorus gramineus TaxID=55184 RepID=A0AAV9ATC9_ACOGR|nr:Leucine-rich repeat receptor-like tyrosine-protein kinase [Acorus gramineus]